MSAPDRTFDAAYERYKLELESLTLFRYAANSHESRGGWGARFKALDSDTARVVQVIGRMMSAHRELLDVGLAILRGINPHAAAREWSAKLYKDASDALSREYDDVERRSGPEVGRLRDYVRPYTLAEKLIVLQTLALLGPDFIGHGWAAQRLAAELNVHLPEKEIAK